MENEYAIFRNVRKIVHISKYHGILVPFTKSYSEREGSNGLTTRIKNRALVHLSYSFAIAVLIQSR